MRSATVLLLVALGCGKPQPPPEPPRTDGGSANACAAPEGPSCPAVTPNCKGIGKPCTKGGNDCHGSTICDLDVSKRGKGMCVIVFCTQADCGTGVTCCD